MTDQLPLFDRPAGGVSGSDPADDKGGARRSSAPAELSEKPLPASLPLHCDPEIALSQRQTNRKPQEGRSTTPAPGDTKAAANSLRASQDEAGTKNNSCRASEILAPDLLSEKTKGGDSKCARADSQSVISKSLAKLGKRQQPAADGNASPGGG